MSGTLYTLTVLVTLTLSISRIHGHLDTGVSARQHKGEGSHWRCYRVPSALPCLKGDNPNRRSWFFDPSTASCRLNPASSGCDVTNDDENSFHTLDECIRTCLQGFAGAEGLSAAEAKADSAAMRTITIMMPVRYNESPAPPAHQQVLPAGVDGGPSHGPLSGQLLGALPHQTPFVVSRWSAGFDVPPSEKSVVFYGPSASTADRDTPAKESSSSPLSPGFFLRLLTGGRPLGPQRDSPPDERPASEIQRQRVTSQARPEVRWHPSQLVQRYMELAGHRDGPRGDAMLKNNVVMTAVAYGLLGAGDRTTSPSTTTAATPSANRKRKFSAEYRNRASGRYRSYPFPGGRRGGGAVRRRGVDFDRSPDSDDEDDEILEALFGYERSPTVLRRVRRPSASSVGARRVYSRRRVGDTDGERRRRWRPRGNALRRPGGRATPSGSVEKQAGRRRRPAASDEPGAGQLAKPAVRPDTDSSQRLSLLHIVVSRQQDFAAPQPPMGFVDHPGLLLEPRPLDIDALHSLSGRPFINPSPPFLPVRPIIPDTQFQQQQDSDDEDTETTADEAKAGGDDDIVTSSNDNMCTLPVAIGDCKSYQNKWYFNHKVGRCEMFFYGGCGGNGNRFETLEHCLRTCAQLVRQNMAADEGGPKDDDDQRMPPGAAASWANVDNVDEQQQTTSKSTDVIVVTSPVYAPMTRDDLESLDLPVGDDVTPAAAADNAVPATHTQYLGSLTSHDVIAPTLPQDALDIHGEESEGAALILGLPRPYIAIIVVLGIVGLVIVVLVTVIATHVCCKARKSKKAEILEEVVKAHIYGDNLNKVVYSESPTIKVDEKL